MLDIDASLVNFEIVCDGNPCGFHSPLMFLAEICGSVFWPTMEVLEKALFLLSRHANVSVRNCLGDTVLHAILNAKRYQERQWRCGYLSKSDRSESILKGPKALLTACVAAGADIYAVNENGETPSMIAAHYNRLNEWIPALEACGYNVESVIRSPGDHMGVPRQVSKLSFKSWHQNWLRDGVLVGEDEESILHPWWEQKVLTRTEFYCCLGNKVHLMEENQYGCETKDNFSADMNSDEEDVDEYTICNSRIETNDTVLPQLSSAELRDAISTCPAKEVRPIQQEPQVESEINSESQILETTKPSIEQSISYNINNQEFYNKLDPMNTQPSSETDKVWNDYLAVGWNLENPDFSAENLDFTANICNPARSDITGFSGLGQDELDNNLPDFGSEVLEGEHYDTNDGSAWI